MKIQTHIKKTIWLSIPLVVSQIGHIITTWTDNAFLGRVDLESQDAGILAGSIFILFLVFLMGLAQGLTPVIAVAHVKGLEKEKASLLKNSLLLNLLASCLLYLLVLIGMNFLGYLKQSPDVTRLTGPFLNILAASLIPLSIFFTLKQYCEGLSNTSAAMYISLSSNILNIILNYVLIFGKFGFPELGYLGAAWATFISRMFMAMAFLVYMLKNKQLSTIRKPLFEAAYQKKQVNLLFFIGIGPATQFVFEVAAFVIAGFMAGWLGKETFAAHGIALSIAAFSYMFVSGVSGAACIRVANYKGLNDRINLRRAGMTGFLISLAIMTVFALVFLCLNKTLPAIFTANETVIRISSQLLLIATLFQLSDGAQVTGLGVLRGLSDVKTPTFMAITSYWAVALPLAWFLAFYVNMGVYGIWFGLLAGLTLAALLLFSRFNSLTKLPALENQAAGPGTKIVNKTEGPHVAEKI